MKLFLIDAMSLIFRAYHALSKTRLQAPSGEPTGAVFGFANILATIINKEQPHYIGIAFDTAAPTFRHEKFEHYKAHRPEFPEELVPQLARIKQMIHLLNIQQIECEGYEADDIIGTLAKRFSQSNIDVYCVTNDKDYCQLVSDRVRLFRPGFSAGEYEIVDVAGVKAKFGVEPEYVRDVLALVGDASDNVPGVKGIGEKTAIPLIQQYGTLEGVYAHLDAIKDTVRKKLEESRDNAFLSKDLVTIHTDVPLQHKLEDFACREPREQELKEFFHQLGFRAIVGRFFKNEASSHFAPRDAHEQAAKNLATIRDTPHEYEIVETPEKVATMVQELEHSLIVAFDVETDGLNAMMCSIVGLSFCGIEGKAYYVPFAAFLAHSGYSLPDVHTQGELFGNLDDEPSSIVSPCTLPQAQWHFPEALLPIKALLENADIPKCGQNAKFDVLVLRRYGIAVSAVEFDTMLASYILNADMQHNMDALAERWLRYAPIPITALIGEKKKQQLSMADVALERVAEYAAEDADVTLRLRNVLYTKLQAEGLLEFAQRVEFPMVEVLAEMEYQGVAVDVLVLRNIGMMIQGEIETLKRSIWEEAGAEFNVDSTKQLGEVLFERMGIPPVKKTKTGYSTDSSVLEELATAYPIAEKILEYRQLAKLQSTYVEALPRLINPHTGRIHTTYNSTVTSTGRLSSTDPNLQNIPVRTELGMGIRKAFIADTRKHPDIVLLSADYSQIELRIMAYMSRDETLIRAFQQGRDIHAATAAVLFGISEHEVGREMRRVAKTVNFGVMYGLGAFGLAQRLKISRAESKSIIENYFAKYPRIKEYIDTTIESARTNGFVTTLLGRRKYYAAINSANRIERSAAERAAINMPIQGTAADMMKLAMIAIHREIHCRGLQSRMLLQIHDELVFEVYPDEIEEFRHIVKTRMEQALPLGDVPVVVEIGVGKHWAAAH
ncbi:MAG: DNA polymerase I [Bacteroidota bacterium]|nr:DNA polymerase I [Candidatus Kapabacteria bacterium]MDW8219394.1 DNA polymerase I [Bacteroidota bacterium]